MSLVNNHIGNLGAEAVGRSLARNRALLTLNLCIFSQ